MEKNNKKNLIIVGLLFATTTSINAQSSMVASGGELTGSGESASVSLGQVHYDSFIGSNGASLGGVQQAFELFEIKSWKDVPYWNEPNEPGLPVLVNIMLFPNPTPRSITVRVTDYQNEVLNYRILDMVGREMNNGIIAQPEVTIDMEGLPAATYFMEVKQGERASVYKLIKSK